MIKQLKTITVAAFFTSTSVYASSWIIEHALDNMLSQVGNAAGARLGDEIYYGSSTHTHKTRHVHVHRISHRKKPKVHKSILTPEKKIQIALRSLGFYRGVIDGEVNSYETRSAIKELNQAYGISTSAFLAPQEKDILIYLGTLFLFDRNLIAKGNDRRTKAKKIQTALKILGFYHDKIDGVAGGGTRRAIAAYKEANNLSYGSNLDFEEEYRLLSGAKEKNDQMIEESIQSLKALGHPTITEKASPIHSTTISKQPNPRNLSPHPNNAPNNQNTPSSSLPNEEHRFQTHQPTSANTTYSTTNQNNPYP